MNRWSMAGVVLALFITICAAFPISAYAATAWAELRTAIKGLEDNLQYLPTQSGERGKAAGIINRWADTKASRDVWEIWGKDDPALQEAAMANIAALSIKDPAARATERTVVAEAAKSLQSTGGSCISILSFEFVRCVAVPLAEWTSKTMLQFGGSILELSGALFDFGVNHLIINFKDTLQTQLQLMPIIDGGWTFFRDLANILIIGIFVFIAVSLILGLTEYGQKKLIARVLIIAVLMNFSLLFTKIIIDSSNFVAYAIYAQTAGPRGTAAAGSAVKFDIADKILKPLRIIGIWDTAEIAKLTATEDGGGGGQSKYSRSAS